MIEMLIPYDNITDQLTRHATKKFGKRDMSKVEAIMIHHSATTNGRAESFARYHVNTLKWPGIGYHMVADADGIKQTNDLRTISYHCSGHNTRTIGVCHTGHFDKRAPNDDEYMNYIRMILIIDALTCKQLPIEYHKDHSSKTCPGSKFDREKFEHLLKEFRFVYS